MATTESSDPVDVDGLTDEALSQSIRWLRQQANALRPDFAAALSLEAKQEVRRSQEALRDQADEFVEKRIKLLAASASTTGSRIKGATDAVDQIIARIDNVEAPVGDGCEVRGVAETGVAADAVSPADAIAKVVVPEIASGKKIADSLPALEQELINAAKVAGYTVVQ